ncbi:hypothetical protein SAMN05216359_10886 [Roseateles sp. YR242]|uniref:hypothetical protein n=1 Tax=Roseateles sp. YR242 TaxID=1855305 RepID=UPI0008B75B9B|nr:hypothetical protein [Roseateles sp. YR242]SEL37575.1 hypothetical protein SAMN05216359_10886 [Roseateles sp. YR242]
MTDKTDQRHQTPTPRPLSADPLEGPATPLPSFMGRRQWLSSCARGTAGALAWTPFGALMAASAAEPVADGAPVRAAHADYTWASLPFGGGGFIDGFLFHPREQGLLYCRTDIGGAYRYDGTARRWLPLLDHLTKPQADLMGVLSLAVDPQDANRLYAACGLYLDAASRDGALLASTDRGATWTIHELGIKIGGNSPGRGSGERLQVDPWHGDTLLLGSSQDGLLRSSDRGRSFQRLPFSPRHVSLVLFDAASGRKGQATRRVYVGSHDQPGLHVSDDGGGSFRRVTETPAQAPQHAAFGPDGVLYVAFAVGDGRHVANPSYATTGSVWKRDTQGRWTDITPVRPGSGARGFGYAGVDADHQRPGRLIVSTFERWADGDDLFLSEDGGRTWAAVGARSTHDLSTHPWLANYKGNTRRPDPMGHWLADVKLDPFNGHRAVYGTGYGLWMTDRLDLATRPASDARVPWRFEVAGIEETATLEIKSPSGGATLLAAMGDVSGAAWEQLDQPPAAGLFAPSNETNRSVDFAQLAPAILARTSDHCATGGYVSVDGGASWKAFGPSPRQARTAQGQRAPTGIVAVSASGGFLVWAPERQAALWSRDKGRTWAPSTGWPASPSPQLWPVADRTVEGVFYLHDRSAGTVLASLDGGASFAPVITGLPVVNDADFAQLVVAPGRARDLWLALPDGLLHFPGVDEPMQRLPLVAQAWMLALGKAAPGASTHALYLWGQVSPAEGAPAQEGLFRSDDAGQRFVRIDDPQHRYGRLLSMAADPLKHGVVFLAPHGRGVVVGRPKGQA